MYFLIKYTQDINKIKNTISPEPFHIQSKYKKVSLCKLLNLYPKI